tara:strand:+ start:1168 stop:2376 length:1209 start_codon:yes stop_codon:yes gene_type:complete
MGGGLMQLVAYGAQDIYLTGNPQITFFKVVYRRHTNFSMEAIEQTINGTVGFGSSVSVTISRNGDLVGRTYVEWQPSSLITGQSSGDVGPFIGNTLLKESEIEIGGQRIDRHYNHWLNIWSSLTERNDTCRSPALGGNTGREPANPTLYSKMSYNHGGINSTGTATSDGPGKAFVPLPFWFCRNPGLALPLIALQYHEVKLKLTICDRSAVSDQTDGTVSFDGFKVMCDYIYLDTDERRRFAQVSHEYLIEQLQFQKGASGTRDELNLNHPVKELIFVGAPATTLNVYAGPSVPTGLAPGSTYKLKLNGHDRFSERDVRYFTRAQIWQHHTGPGGESLGVADSIGVYSFSLKPEEHQPSGTCNFSRIDNATFEHPTDTVDYYAVNYNVLRIMSGMGGLAYSN